MTIQWFPGHMHSTRKAMAERIKDIDAVVEVLDARMPGSSCNPLLAELTAGKPSLKVLNKQDTADADRTAAWLLHYNAKPDVSAIALDASMTAPARQIIDACHLLAPNRGGMAKPMRVMICGVPNVGKSTLINTLTGVKKAKTGDEAGITKMEQRIVLADDFYLWDTPGMLWPRIAVAQVGDRLAAGGAIGRNAYDEEGVALDFLNYVKGPYADLLKTRFRLDGAIDDIQQMKDEDLLEFIGRQRGALLGKGRVNLQKAAEIVIHEFRSLALGRMTLETPEEFARWQAEGDRLSDERAAKKAARKDRLRAG
ncbi:ribosome biogenesis GTPase YlqF [Xylophilus sp. GOD-11R]|uniref:ribosome biogenesis GTPase YlqF n=1 Tax=Xylophilus sp. GOD-11R TaxID=3089814 RepID=UPI00298C1CD4|nr:ribosome biogenesis GTPase YlqF [Xylophilus sp. GOD-11R]WPB55167.1 ribosome biogenesis GTPase YlqF [Xylophilus sp. GOD-11R]